MIRLTIAPLAALALVSCNSQPGVSLTNATGEEVAAAARKAGVTSLGFRPGKWESKVELIEMNMPGMEKMPPAIAEQLKAKMSEARVTASCMTPEDAQKPGSELFTGQGSKNCTFSNYTMSEGRIDATMVCKEPQGEMRMHMAGTFAAETFTIQSEVTGKSAGGDMSSKARVTGKRIGDCGPEDAKK